MVNKFYHDQLDPLKIDHLTKRQGRRLGSLKTHLILEKQDPYKKTPTAGQCMLLAYANCTDDCSVVKKAEFL